MFLDFANTFDKVPHKKLLLQPYAIGGSSKHVDMIGAYLDNRVHYVEVDSKTSDTLPVTSGVPQDSVLVPILSLIYINAIVNIVDSEVPIKLFSDDCVLHTPVISRADQTRLNAT